MEAHLATEAFVFWIVCYLYIWQIDHWSDPLIHWVALWELLPYPWVEVSVVDDGKMFTGGWDLLVQHRNWFPTTAMFLGELHSLNCDNLGADLTEIKKIQKSFHFSYDNRQFGMVTILIYILMSSVGEKSNFIVQNDLALPN